MNISKCDSCKNESICKWCDRMKEYEDKIKELYGHRDEIEPCPVSIGASCSKYEVNTEATPIKIEYPIWRGIEMPKEPTRFTYDD